MRRYALAGLQLRIACARMLLDLAGKVDDVQLPDLLTFAGQIGDCTAADNLAAFRAGQTEALHTAQIELDRLIEPDAVRA